MQKGDISYGDIIWTSFDPSVGHEYQDKRPAIVIQSNAQLKKSETVTVVPLTSKTSKVLRDDILISANSANNLRTDSVVKTYPITSFDYSRFSKKIGVADRQTMGTIKNYLKKHFGL